MKFESNFLRSLAVLALGGLALVSCQEATSSDDSGPMLARVRIFFADSSRVPDSTSWKAPADSGHGRFGCDDLDCTDTLALAQALGKDTAHLSLWSLGIRCGTISYTQSGRSLYLDTVAGSAAHDSLDLKLLLAFRSLRQSKPDSLAAFGTPRFDLVYGYAKFVLAQDTGYKGFPAVHPIGMSVDSVKKALVYWAAKSNKTWEQLVALGIGLNDSATIHADAIALFAAGKLAASDTEALFPRASVTKDTIVPSITRGSGTFSRSVVFDTTKAALSWTVTDNHKVVSITLNGTSLAVSSNISVSEDLAVGTNRFILVATDSTGNARQDTVTIVRNAMAPTHGATSGNYIGTVYDTLTSTGADSIQFSTNGTNWFTYSGDVELGDTGSHTIYAKAWPGGAISSATYVISRIEMVAAGNYHTAFVKTNGSLWTTGKNNDGQLGTGNTTDTSLPVQILQSGVATASAGYYHTLVLRKDGMLYGTGYNGDGEMGNGATANLTMLTQIANNVSAISAGLFHSTYVTASGALMGSGINNMGQLGTSSAGTFTSFRQIDSDVGSVSSSGGFTLYLKSTNLYGCGSNSSGQLGLVDTSTLWSPSLLASGVSGISAGWNYSLWAESSNSTLWGTGDGTYGQLGDNSAATVFSPVQIPLASIASMTTGWSHSLVVTSDGSLYGMGYAGDGELGNVNATAVSTPTKLMSNVAKTFAGGRQSFVLKADGSLWAAGRNTEGELGVGTRDNAYSFKRVNF